MDSPPDTIAPTPLRTSHSLIRSISKLGTETMRSITTALNQAPSVLSFESLSPTPSRANSDRNLSISETTRREFHNLMNRQIPDKHQRHFLQYFPEDINKQTITLKDFCKLFKLTPLLGRRVLNVFNLNESYEHNSISRESILSIACRIWMFSPEVKAYLVFKLFDVDNDERISMEEIRSFYMEHCKELKPFESDRKLTEDIKVLLEEFFPNDTENEEQESRELDFDQFYDILQKDPLVFESLYLIDIPSQEDEDKTICYKRWWLHIKNNTNHFAFLILYILISIALIVYVVVYRVVVIKNHTVWQVFARIGGMLVNFNFALAITLMLKQTMTIIRRIYFIRLFVPVDEHIDAHRFVGTMLFISSMIHSLGHVIQFATHLNGNSWFALMFTTAAQIGWVSDSATITGDILFVFLIIMFVFALQCVRERSGFYQLFCYTHLLFWPVFILLVIHAPNFWKWAVGPMSLLVVEKVYLLIKRHLSKYGRTRLISVRIEDENALSLIFKRPDNFQFHVGEYINICLPHIVSYEWHPFTISSSPERKDFLRVSIFKKKNWTKKVYEHFSSKLKQSNRDHELTEIVIDSSNNQPQTIIRTLSSIPKEIHFDENEKDAEIYIEGPFSSCTSYIFDCEHVVLIGGGIGITPYISALESLIHRLREQRCVCFRCGSVNYNESRFTGHKLKKVDFIWINRELANFSWFLNVLDEFEAEQEAYLNSTSANPEEQRSRYLDIHLYCTSVRSNEQAMLANLPYDLAANMYVALKNQDMYTHLRTSTHFGRPQWKTLFAKFKAEQRSTNVFFTGGRQMGDQIKKYCDENRFKYQHEPFF